MFARFIDRLVNTLAVLAGMMLVILTALICADVFARYFNLFSMPWAFDAAKYLLYGITFFGAPWVLRDGGHIKIDLLVDNLNARAKARCLRISQILGAVISLILTFYACRIVYRSLSQNVIINETFVFPEWWLFSIAPPIFFILFLVFVRLLMKSDSPEQFAKTPPQGF